MKLRISGLALLLFALAACQGCAENLHKPTTAANAGTSALVAYAAAGFTAAQYLKLPLCATPPAYPCKMQAINDKLLAADMAAYTAARAADAAGNAAQAAPQINALQSINASPEVQSQTKNGGTP